MKKLLLILMISPFLIMSLKGQPLIVYNNTLIYISKDSIKGIKSIVKYDGSTATSYPNPDGGLGYKGSPIICDNNLYYQYLNKDTNYVLAFFNGNTSAFFSSKNTDYYGGSPVIYQNRLLGIYISDTSSLSSEDTITNGYIGSPIIFNNKLYFRYHNNKDMLAEYDGINTAIYNNPDTGKGFYDSPVVYNNELFFQYKNSLEKIQMATLSSNTVKLISNPDNGGVNGFPIVYNKDLYIRYMNISGDFQLSKYAGSILTLIPNPDLGLGYNILSPPIVMSTNLFFGYIDASNINHIAKFNGTTVTIIPNPDNGSGYTGTIILYNGNLYFGYSDLNNKSRLAKCDGNTISLLPNPDAGFGYEGNPVIYNDKLYFMYANAAKKFQLAEYDDVSIKLIPNTYMGKYFPPCTKFCPPPPSGHENGPYTQSLSNILELKASGIPMEMIGSASIYPNPATSSLKIVSSLIPAIIEITDVSGRIVSQITTSSHETYVNVSELKEGVYVVSIRTEKTTTVKKFIRE